MAHGQTIVENGRVSLLFKTLLSIAAALITAGILAQFAISWRTNNSLASLDKSVSLISNDLKYKDLMDARQDNDISRIRERVSQLERAERRRERDDSRD